jgi:DNA-binding YbaB/EbfC family protein
MKNPFGNMNNILKQAQAMQEQMARIQEQAASKTATGTSGGGIVTVTANGAMQIVSVVIDPEVVKSGDVDMLQDLVVAATNEALRKAKELMESEMKSLTGGMKIPGLFYPWRLINRDYWRDSSRNWCVFPESVKRARSGWPFIC